MERHVALVATHVGVAEVLHDVGRPLVRLGEQHAAGELAVDRGAHLPQVLVRAGEVLAVRALLLEQVGHRVETEAVDAEVEPEAQDVEHRLAHGRVLEVEVGLVAEEAVPEELSAHRVVGPVRRLGVDEDDAGVAVRGVVVGPHVEVAVRAVGVLPRGLEPRVRVGRVVQHEVGDDADAAAVRLLEQVHEVVDRAELGQHGAEVADVVAAVAQGRGVERGQPQAVDAEPLQVVELVGQAAEVARAVAVGVGERAHQDLVEHRALEPFRVARRLLGVREVVGLRLDERAVGLDRLAGVRDVVETLQRGVGCGVQVVLVVAHAGGSSMSGVGRRLRLTTCAQARVGSSRT